MFTVWCRQQQHHIIGLLILYRWCRYFVQQQQHQHLAIATTQNTNRQNIYRIKILISYRHHIIKKDKLGFSWTNLLFSGSDSIGPIYWSPVYLYICNIIIIQQRKKKLEEGTHRYNRTHTPVQNTRTQNIRADRYHPHTHTSRGRYTIQFMVVFAWAIFFFFYCQQPL